MRKPRAVVQIPRALAAEIDKLVGERQRTLFIVNLVERELRRRQQLEALQSTARSANGAESWIQEMRHEATHRLERITRQR